MNAQNSVTEAIFTARANELRREVVRKYTELATAPADDHQYAARLRELEAIGYPKSVRQLPREAVEAFSGVGCPLRYAPARAGERVLDIGVGPGLDAVLASSAVGDSGNVVGLDMNPAMLERCHRLLRRLGCRNVALVQADGELLAFPDASFDLIVSNGVCNLSPRKDLLFSEMARVLRGGGRLALADVILEVDLDDATRNDPSAWSSWVAGALPETAFLAALQKAGFSGVELITKRQNLRGGITLWAEFVAQRTLH